uniref:WLM domain-containing protein n=1 Tax=viral metagenome TaxID=1070528 RepID=A0A6C0KJC7_9ZZZZ
MKRENILGYVLLGFILLIIIKCYYDNDFFQLKCIVSDVNGKKYCVRERSKLKEASDLLAKTTMKLEKLVDHVKTNYEHEERVQRLVKNFKSDKIKEILPTSEYTAYSENKGEKIAFCLSKKDKKDLNHMIDENTLTFVALHEMSHLATKSIGHKDEFWENFKFLIEQANKINIYTPVDYEKQKAEYCGMTIKDNPYFDN